MTQSRPTLLPALAIATTILVWATAFPAIKLALTELQPLPLASIRYAIAALLAVFWLIWTRPVRMPFRHLLLCAACGIVGGAGYSVLLNIGQQTVAAGAASFLIKTESLWMATLAVLLLKERFSPIAWGGTLLCIVGIGLIASAQAGGLTLNSGAAFVLAAALCSASGFTVQRHLVARYGALHVAAIMFIAAALALSPWLPLALTQTGNATTTVRIWIAFLGVFPTAIGLVCWAYALGRFGVARAGNFLYLIAPLAMLIAWMIAGEPPKTTTVMGGMLILAGVIIVNTRGKAATPQIQTMAEVPVTDPAKG
ncbi:DMT family transporter [Phyllobacterium myrsinacearum]|uniref:Drug/metabolite transporter (DMT)-like permease n=1 Tax=Phyllobacterium myrsinacearum TaxID=28101 RepID=A0A839ESA3_9HYPH|nr:DMT family transporter [Phyllobacterium myrsinacearum]MBA8879490.1 drug/metabolite transporter (DMT)-like permease [Phyllobacterium myrsinacearum]